MWPVVLYWQLTDAASTLVPVIPGRTRVGRLRGPIEPRPQDLLVSPIFI